MIINGIIAMIISFYLYPDIKNILNGDTFSISIKLDLFSLLYIGIFILFMIVHEFIHGIFIPNGLKSDKILLPFILKLFGLLNGFTIALCVINAMGSAVDCFNILLILNQAPKDSYIVNNGTETYFKKNYY